MENLPPSPLFHKPPGIIAAKNLLYTSIFLALLTWGLGRMAWSNVPASTSPQTIVTLIVTIVLLFTLTKCITSGMKWARLVLLVLFLLGLVPVILTFGGVWQASPLVAILTLVQTILQALALAYLY